MSEINCKYINSCYLSKDGKYIKKDMLMEIRYIPKNIYLKDNRLIFVFNDNIIKKLTIWNTIIKTLINFSYNDKIYPMSNLNNSITLGPELLIKNIKEKLENTNNFNINNTINFIISKINQIEELKNIKKEVEIILLGYEDCLDDLNIKFKELFLKIYTSIKYKENIKLNFKFFEYSLDEEMKIHKLIINNNNINYNFLQYEYKNNENFDSEIKKKF